MTAHEIQTLIGALLRKRNTDATIARHLAAGRIPAIVEEVFGPTQKRAAARYAELAAKAPPDLVAAIEAHLTEEP